MSSLKHSISALNPPKHGREMGGGVIMVDESCSWRAVEVNYYLGSPSPRKRVGWREPQLN